MIERSTMKRRLTAALLLTLGALLAVPAMASAGTTFGSRFKNEPNTSNCSESTSCSLVSYIEPIDPNGDPYAGGVPISGVITSFELYARTEEPTAVTFFAANTQLNGSDDSAFSQVTATGPTANIPVSGENAQTFTVPARVPVQAGQHIGISFSGDLQATYNSSGDKFTYAYSPRLETDRRPSFEATGELTLRATVEPDADGDGFGDETQDKCPSQAATQGPCVPPARDVTPPGLSGLSANPVGVSYFLSEASTVSLKLEGRLPGRKVGKKCVKPTAKNHEEKACKVTKQFGSFAGPGTAGVPITVSFASLGLHKLKAGRYTLTLTATDAAGNATSQQTTFTIKPPKKKKKTAPPR